MVVVRHAFSHSAILGLFLWLLVFSSLLNISSNKRMSVFARGWFWHSFPEGMHFQKKSKSNNSVLWKQYRRQRNYVTKLMREAEALYWKDKFENANSSGDFWKVVREMQGK